MTETKAAMQNAAQYVVDNMSQRGMLEQLAEECSELAKASLKLIRAAGLSDNPTPTDRAEAIDMLQEEIDDVVSLIFLLTGDKRLEYMRNYWKIERWACRLACGCEAEEDNNEAKKKEAVTEICVD